jgi:hypothetical protein
VTKGPGSRAAGVAVAFKLIESAQTRWRAVNAPHLVALIRAGAVFKNGKLIERPDESEVVISKARDTPTHRSPLILRPRLRGAVFGRLSSACCRA